MQSHSFKKYSFSVFETFGVKSLVVDDEHLQRCRFREIFPSALH